MGPVHPSLALPAPLTLGIPPSTAHLLSFLSTTSYVASLYLAQTLVLPRYTGQVKWRTSGTSSPGVGDGSAPTPAPAISSTDQTELDPHGPKPGDRDHPATIRIRMRAVFVATVMALGGVWWVVKTEGRYTPLQAVRPTLALLGIPASLLPISPTTILPYLLAPTLLFGPLVAMYLDRDLPFQRRIPGQTFLSDVKALWSSWGPVESRNYVVGPITEELVFRSAILSVSLLGKLSMGSLVFGTPLWFGIAHAHHAFDTYKRNGADALAAKRAIATSLFQLTYTTLFGWFASYLFLRTGSILPPLISHIFCNAMGIYLPSTAIQRHPRRKALIWSSYLLGIAGFILGIRRV